MHVLNQILNTMMSLEFDNDISLALFDKRIYGNFNWHRRRVIKPTFLVLVGLCGASLALKYKFGNSEILSF